MKQIGRKYENTLQVSAKDEAYFIHLYPFRIAMLNLRNAS